MSTFHIIYPGGDKRQLQVLELSFSEYHELADYALASRQEFADRSSAVTYAKELARAHGKQLLEVDASGRAQEFLD